MFGIENKSGESYIVKNYRVKSSEGRARVCNDIRRYYCIALTFLFFVFCFLLNEEKLCLRVAYFYWSKSE